MKIFKNRKKSKKKGKTTNLSAINNIGLIQFTSDLHLEFYKEDMDIKTWLIPSAPYLAILGDLGYPYHKNFMEFLSQVSKIYKKVFFVPGNHEYYQYDVQKAQTIEEINLKIKKICSSFDNVFMLNNNEYILDNYIILGTTLWSKIPEEYEEMIKYNINDYNDIYYNLNNEKRLITTQFINAEYIKNLNWLENTIEKYKDKKKIIIMTHHLPSLKLIHKKYDSCPVNCAFASDLDYLIEKYVNIKYWLCGHTHSHVKATINNCLCIANPFGYNEKNEVENKAYDKQKIIIL